MMESAPSVTELDELIERAKDGSHAAFSRIVRLYQARVRTYLGRFVRGRDQVDDLAQETFLAAYRGLGEFKGQALFGTWLLGIARHRGLAHLRERERRGERRNVPLDSTLAECLADRMAAEPASPTEHERRLEALEKCMAGVGPKVVTLVGEFYFRRRRCAEIARGMATNEGAVWMALVRVRRALRYCIERRLASSGADL